MDLKLETSSDWSDWKFLKLSERKLSAYDLSDYSDYTKQHLPELVKWIDLFPFISIRNIKFNIQKADVTPHIDFTKPKENVELFENNKTNDPCGYRVLIAGSRTNSMYIVHKGVKIYTTLPEETDVYVLRHTDGIHGVDFEPGRQTMFFHFEIDQASHNKLLAASYNKYKQYAILQNDLS